MVGALTCSCVVFELVLVAPFWMCAFLFFSVDRCFALRSEWLQVPRRGGGFFHLWIRRAKRSVYARVVSAMLCSEFCRVS